MAVYLSVSVCLSMAVYLSESVVFVEESDAGTTNSETYTVVLTHPPGMREDETVSTLGFVLIQNVVAHRDTGCAEKRAFGEGHA